MSLPPSDIAPDALWVALQQMPRPQRVVDYPRLDPVTGKPAGKVTLRVLSQAELMSAAAATDKYTIDTLKRSPKKDETSHGYEAIYNNESTVQLLFRAVYRARQVGPETWEPVNLPFFPSPDAIRGVDGSTGLTQEELATLLRMYFVVQRELGPIVDRMTPEEADAWIDRLAEGGSAFPLASLESDAVTDLVMHMVRLLRPSSTGITSSGSPPDERSSEPTKPSSDASARSAKPARRK